MNTERTRIYWHKPSIWLIRIPAYLVVIYLLQYLPNGGVSSPKSETHCLLRQLPTELCLRRKVGRQNPLNPNPRETPHDNVFGRSRCDARQLPKRQARRLKQVRIIPWVACVARLHGTHRRTYYGIDSLVY